MNLEFELEIQQKGKQFIHYSILRKGLVVGLMVLEAPYTHEEAIKKLITMHNTYEESKC